MWVCVESLDHADKVKNQFYEPRLFWFVLLPLTSPSSLFAPIVNFILFSFLSARGDGVEAYFLRDSLCIRTNGSHKVQMKKFKFSVNRWYYIFNLYYHIHLAYRSKYNTIQYNHNHKNVNVQYRHHICIVHTYQWWVLGNSSMQIYVNGTMLEQVSLKYPNTNNVSISFIFFPFCFVLFCFVLFCFVLFCFVLFCFVLFCFVLFCL